MNDTTPTASYRVLARKYRPSTFAELIGQDAMVRTISNGFEAGRIPQAWVLTGLSLSRYDQLAIHPEHCRRV